MTRIYDIELSCGCLYSSYGDYCIPCLDDENCKCQEEYYKKLKDSKEKEE